MKRARVHQLFTVLAHCSIFSTVFLLVGSILTLGNSYIMIVVVAAVISALIMTISLSIVKRRPFDLYLTASTTWVNTAAGARPADEGLHHPRPADSGVLLRPAQIFNLPYFTDTLSMIWFSQVATTISTLILKLCGWATFIPVDLARRLQAEGLLGRELGELAVYTMALFIMVMRIKMKQGLQQAPWLTVQAACMASSGLHSRIPLGTANVVTFIDPVSGRVRRVYREDGEAFEPAKAKAKTGFFGAVRTQGA